MKDEGRRMKDEDGHTPVLNPEPESSLGVLAHLREVPPLTPNAQRPTPDSPIADLSYRNYDGPLHTRAIRWWIIAMSVLRQARSKPAFWVFAGISLWPYLRSVLFLYLDSNNLIKSPPGAPNFALMMGIADPTVGQRFAFQLYGALTTQWFIWLIPVALIVGSGSIALDTRANALQIYFSKPITKADYLLGKWTGVFLALFGVTIVPQLFLFGYCWLSYASDGFFKQEPLLFFRMIAACCIPAAIHASLLIGFSAWSKTPRMAGALYAGLYFATWLVDQVLWRILHHGHLGHGEVVRHLHVHGLIEALTQTVFGLTIHTITGNRHWGIEEVLLKPPSPAIMATVALVVVAAALVAARTRIRAVEVVRG